MRKTLLYLSVISAFALGSQGVFAYTAGDGASAPSSGTAIGQDATTSTHGVVVGHSSSAAAQSSTVVGARSGVDSSSSGSVVVGTASSVKENATNSIVIGSNINSSVSGGIALGATVNRAAGQAGFQASTGTNSTQTGGSWVSGNGAMAIGTASNTRQIVGVAAGSEDTDAVNVAQLKDLKQYGDNSYATQDALGSYLKTTDAGNTYLTQTNAQNTYATKASLSDYLTISDASNDYLSIANAEGTYSTKEQLDNLSTAVTSDMSAMTVKVAALETELGALKDLTPETISALKNLTENGVFTVETPKVQNQPAVSVLTEDTGDEPSTDDSGSGNTPGGDNGDNTGSDNPGTDNPGSDQPGTDTPTSDKATVGLGNKLNFTGDSNVLTSLSQDEDGNVTVKFSMAEDASVNSLTANEITTGNLTVNQTLTANTIEAQTVTAQTVQGADIVATNSLTAPSITFADGPTLSYNKDSGRLQYASNTAVAAEGEGSAVQSLATTSDGITFGANEGSALVNLDNQKLDIKGADEFITTSITSNGNGATLEIKMTDEFRMAMGNGNLDNGITIGAKDGYQEIRIQQGDINMGGNRIQGVGDGVAATDAVNKRQLDNATRSLHNKINDVDKDLRAGVAMAMAVAGLPQAYMPGKSILAMSAGTYRGQGGFALGLSHATENRAWVFKGAATVDTRGNIGGTIGAGYQF